MIKRILSLFCVIPLTITCNDYVYEVSNKHNRFERNLNQNELNYQSHEYERIVDRYNREKAKRDQQRKEEIIKSLKEKYIKYIKKLKEEEERIRKEKREAEEQKKKQIQNRGLSGEGNILFELTFYTDLPEENGGHTITASGKPLEYGVVASNKYPIGTKLRLGSMGTFTVEDRGGREFNNSNRLDVFIPRQSGESNCQYKNRVRNMGRIKLKGDIL